MPTFRNQRTGTTIVLQGRWAEHARRNPDLVELDEQGEQLPSEPDPIRDTDPALMKLRKADLVAMCEAEGKDTSGNKADLVSRLTASGGAE